jgi:acyl-CoA synthetase (AMP-forming)/AMP-acid ligase II
VCVLGAERIDWRMVQDATSTFAPFGLRASAWMPAYGLAEATLVVTATGIEEEPSRLVVDTVALAEGELREVPDDGERSTSIVAVGTPPSGIGVRLADDERLSEILIRSPSMFSGYFADPELTAERLADGEFATGDLGFERDGSLYVVGRADDLLSVGGRNVYAREIEASVDTLDGVRPGCSTIVDAGGADGNGSQRLVMLLELKDGEVDTGALAREAARTATSKAGIPLDECVFLPKGSLPKTPSGKIQRFRCRQLMLADRLEPVARVEL